MKALGRLFSLKTTLLRDTHFDYVILDTSPGFQYSSINAIISADVVLVVTTLDKSDIEGTLRMIHDLYDLFEKKTGIIVNKVLLEFLSPQTWEKKAVHIANQKTPILGQIPCFCDLLRTEGIPLFASETPDHPFTKTLLKLATKIEHFTT